MATCYGVTPSLRDNEDAYVSVNGKTCWSKTKAVGTSGTQECGGFFKEETFRVTGCEVTLSGSTETIPLEVHVWTSLDGDPGDESFGIDNVRIKKIANGDDLPPPTTKPLATCDKCGVNAKSGKLTCCARKGAWFEKCGDDDDPNFDHTWTEGFDACMGKLG